MVKLYDEATNRWYELRRNILGGLKLSTIKDKEPSPGDLLLTANGLCIVAIKDDRLDVA